MTGPSTIHDVAVDAVLRQTTGDTGPVVAPDPGVGARLAVAGRQVTDEPLASIGDEKVAAVVLTGDELSREGVEAERLLHDAARVLVPDGLLAVSARNRVFAELTGLPHGLRGFSANEFERLLGHYGFAPSLVCAPGAARRLRASLDPSAVVDDTALDVEADRDPGLLHAAPQLFAVATSAVDARARSERFFATLPRKVVAASTLCRADDGRVLIVHDAFKRHWTIPGGVVDPDESPREGAEREAWEETGLRIAAGAVLGVFAGSWPDRVVFVYDGLPVGGGAPAPHPVHEHEVDAAEWVPVAEALARLAPHVAFQVRRCLSEPGGTWTHPHA
jgi:8-oxo-dGTP pyrophosphatase MutT (NUDIX family)